MPTASSFPTIGVLGGMGPAATADFFAKLVAATPARCDQEHLPVLIHSVPQIPDRASCFLHGGPSPAPMLGEIARGLEQGGAAMIVMPCNTAHLWHDAVARAVRVPVLHIVDPVLQALQRHGIAQAGLLGTTATVQAGLYRQRDSAGRIRWLAPQAGDQQRVTAGIAAVKAGDLAQGRKLLLAAARALVAEGAQALVYACTEVPLVLQPQAAGVPSFDATQLLAEAAVQRAVHWALQS
ncbi:aspartate/glutamate racemase family protein [Ideonella sp. BN130291]|uniref:aspartate/glutamate racemase family protein n=1 Tax=Ideonella sp. BN130291 TaxID=3112940 RepID=UPI002E255D42|nr:amino acid racemase [Ideonella sp. BN130291]